MGVSFNKTGVVSATGTEQIKDKSGNTIQNTYDYTHGFVEDDSDTQAMSIFDDYILVTELIEY